MLEYNRFYDEVVRAQYEMNLATYLDYKSMNPKTLMQSFIQITEARNKVKNNKHPTNFVIYEFYLQLINLISQSELFHTEYYTLMQLSSLTTVELFKQCNHIIACSMINSFDLINKIGHKNIYLNLDDTKNETISDASKYYTGSIKADNGL